MADAPDSKSGSGNRVRVQVPPPAFTKPASDAGFVHIPSAWGPVGGQKRAASRARDRRRRHAAARPETARFEATSRAKSGGRHAVLAPRRH